MLRTIVLLMTIISSAYSVEIEEILAPDKVLHGLWYVSASAASGEEFTFHELPELFCRLSPTTMTLSDQTEVKIDQVFLMDNDEGVPTNMIMFNNDRAIYTYYVERLDCYYGQLFDTSDSENFTEMMIFLYNVER